MEADLPAGKWFGIARGVGGAAVRETKDSDTVPHGFFDYPWGSVSGSKGPVHEGGEGGGDFLLLRRPLLERDQRHVLVFEA